jgi:hypothetical protein
MFENMFPMVYTGGMNGKKKHLSFGWEWERATDSIKNKTDSHFDIALVLVEGSRMKDLKNNKEEDNFEHFAGQI